MKYFFILLIVLILTGCKEKSTNSNEYFKLSGYVTYENAPAENVLIRVDDEPGLTATTDKAGYFEIHNLNAGEHHISVYKDLPDEAFSAKMITLEINGDVFIENFKLPKGVELFLPENVTSNSLFLRWSATDAVDFREYKLFQHTSSGLDETTGELIHVSTGRMDTSFSVADLDPFKNYFFRIYIMNDLGKLGGSNIVTATTENLNAIDNGSFEIIDPYTNFAENWQITSIPSDTHVEIDPAVSYDGSNSVYFFGIQGEYAFSTIATSILPDKLTPGDNYELSFWVKHDTLAAYHQGWIDFYPISSRFYSLNGPMDPSGWVQLTKTFTIPADTNPVSYDIQFHFAQIFNIVSPDIPLSLWIDQFELKKVN